jgi:hypothetical protein
MIMMVASGPPASANMRTSRSFAKFRREWYDPLREWLDHHPVT